jgi:heat shock protein HtpX
MREIKEGEYPWLHSMLDELVKKAGLPKKPKLYLVYDSTPNAFAFGWSKSRAFIAVHSGLIEMLNKDEIKAVLAHEVGHIKHNDVVLMTIASMIPTIIYYLIIAAGSLLTARARERERGGIYPLLVFLGAYVAQFFTYLLVLYLSRVREFFSDAFSAVVTNPKYMRTALAKISYGFPIIAGTKLRQYQTRRAFFIADPVAAVRVSQEVRKGKLEKEIEESVKKREEERRKLDLGKELTKAMEWERTNPAAKLIQMFSTHPLCYRRIDALYELEKEIKAGKVTLESV